MKGWFDAFRHDGGPTLYDHANRTAVTGDVPTITLCVVFITLFAAFLIVFPGIRKERLTTFISVTLSLFVGAVIVAGNFGSNWHVADGQITSAYRSFSSEKIFANLGVHIGLNSVNVTLRSAPMNNLSERIDFNERFCWHKPDDMQHEFQDALRKGLPYPILTVAEYLSLDEEGFSWGRKYRNAGYYTCIALWSAFASWFLMNIFLLAVPRYGAYAMLLTGSLMISANVIYYLCIPHRALVIRFEAVALVFSFGWTYWLVLAAGLLCIVAGVVVSVMECLYPNKFSTVLEIDYGTPYDRHIIIEESHDRKHKPKLEEPNSLKGSFSSKILRRLSKKSDSSDTKFGFDNPAMEMDPPKSPWRYPHHRVMVSPSRTESRRSTKSVNFGSMLHPSSASVTTASTEQFQLETLAESNNEDVAPKLGSQTTWSSSASQSDGEEEIERVGAVVVPTAADFQRQFRNSRMSRAGSQMSHHSRARNSSSSISGSSTPVRKISGDSDTSDDVIHSISARISAIEEAAYSNRHSGDDESQTSVEMW